ncbi:hypothetical protein C1634_008850 [Chryseobacterium viscerum]|uniref:Uncharacterized protein n=1 Tax=Chryseobacterium viscerum TaxID=1037377 RepID=A0A316WN70_9FLAO|nr:hypothetical protein C1634_008850 [Chryseobacterium viscerum]
MRIFFDDDFQILICEICAKTFVKFVFQTVNPKNPDENITGILIGYSLKISMQLPASYDRLRYFEVNFTVKIKGFLKNKKKNIGMRKTSGILCFYHLLIRNNRRMLFIN